MTRKILRYLGLATLLLCAVQLGLAQTQIAVTGHLGPVGNNPSTPTIYQVQFSLAYCGANVPRIFGVQTDTATSAVFTADANGLLTGSIWPNDVITCGGVVGGTRYNVSFITNGSRVGPTQCFQVIGAGPFNLDTAQPCAVVPPPTPPPGTQDAHVNNLTVDGLLAGVNAIFSGDVRALTFHFSTSGAHFTCPGGQFANALNQDFSFACAAPGSAPVVSVFGRTGAVAAAVNDYNFNQLAGTIADAQFLAITHVYPIQVTEAVHLTGTPTHASCNVTANQAISSVSADNAANLSCNHIAVPASSAQAMTITALCPGGGPNNNCICAPGSSSTYDSCSTNIAFPVAFTTALDGATANCVDQPPTGSAGSNGSALCNVLSGNITGVTVVIQNNRSTTANPATLFVTAVGH